MDVVGVVVCEMLSSLCGTTPFPPTHHIYIHLTTTPSHTHPTDSPLITLSPDGSSLYVLPRNNKADADTKAAVAGDIVVLAREAGTGGVKAMQDVGT